MRPPCCGNTRSQLLPEFGTRDTWQPDPHISGLSPFFPLSLFVPVPCPKLTYASTGLGTNHHQIDLSFDSLRQRYFFCLDCFSPTSACPDPMQPLQPSLNIVSSKNALQLLSAMLLSDLSRVTLSLYVDFRTHKQWTWQIVHRSMTQPVTPHIL